MGTPLPLERLEPGQLIVVGGDRAVAVTDELAAAFAAGDRLVVLPDTGDVLHIPAAEHEAATEAVSAAYAAFEQLSGVSDEQITAFFAAFADRLGDDDRSGSDRRRQRRRRRRSGRRRPLDDPADADRTDAR